MQKYTRWIVLTAALLGMPRSPADAVEARPTRIPRAEGVWRGWTSGKRRTGPPSICTC